MYLRSLAVCLFSKIRLAHGPRIRFGERLEFLAFESFCLFRVLANLNLGIWEFWTFGVWEFWSFGISEFWRMLKSWDFLSFGIVGRKGKDFVYIYLHFLAACMLDTKSRLEKV